MTLHARAFQTCNSPPTTLSSPTDPAEPVDSAASACPADVTLPPDPTEPAAPDDPTWPAVPTCPVNRITRTVPAVHYLRARLMSACLSRYCLRTPSKTQSHLPTPLHSSTPLSYHPLHSQIHSTGGMPRTRLNLPCNCSTALTQALNPSCRR
jgi:hypothetical protein